MSLKGKIIIFFNPDQSPSGKSSLSLMLANCIHYVHKQDVVLINCDPIERFGRKLQLRDKELSERDEFFAASFQRDGRTPVLSILETGETNLFHLLHEMKKDDDSTIVIDCKNHCNEKVLDAIDTVADYVIIPTDISQFAYKFGCFYAHCFSQISDNINKYMLLRNQVAADSQVNYPTEMYLHENIKTLEYPEIIHHSVNILNDAHQFNTYFWSENSMSLQISQIVNHIIEKVNKP